MFQIDSHGVCGFRRSGLVSFSVFNRYLPPLPYLLCIKVVGGGGVGVMVHCYWDCSKTTEILIEDAATTTMYGRLEKSLCTVAVAEAFLVRRGWKNKIQQQGGLPTTTASFVCVQVERLRRQLGRSGGGGWVDYTCSYTYRCLIVASIELNWNLLVSEVIADSAICRLGQGKIQSHLVEKLFTLIFPPMAFNGYLLIWLIFPLFTP